MLAAAIGIPLSLLAAAVPALEASRVPPTSAMRGHDMLEMRTRLRPIVLVAPLGVLALAAWLAQRVEFTGSSDEGVEAVAANGSANGETRTV